MKSQMGVVRILGAAGLALLMGALAPTLGVDASPPALAAAAPPVLLDEHECSYCHDLHGGSQSQLLNDPVVESLCMSCHGPGGPSVLKAEVHDYSNSTCTDCHVTHSNVTNHSGGTNIKLIRAWITAPKGDIEGDTRPVVFQSRGTDVGDPVANSFCDGQANGPDGTYDGVCDTCHDDKDHGYYDGSKHDHRQGRTCTTCHEHVRKFKKP